MQNDVSKFQIKTIVMSAPKRSKTSYPPLRLVSFTSKGTSLAEPDWSAMCRLGVQCSSTNRVVDLFAVNAAIPADMKAFLETGEIAMKAASKSVSYNC